ncbi:MAG: Gfo/Idh/MocA family protein [Kiritimatiellia bacterium]
MIQIGRREFLFKGLATACALGTRRTWAQAATPPSKTITMAILGAGARGRQMLPVFLNQPGVRFLAACDALRARREWAKAEIDAYNGNTDCRLYADFREMLARPDIDALYIATGDRWHARLAIAAMRAGKDVYCEKPIALSIEEGEAVMRASELYQRIYQGGVQRRNVGNFVTAMRLATSGRLGRVHTVHAGMAPMGRSAANHYLPEEPLPDKRDFDWDMWTGPAPLRPYNAQYVLNHKWHDEYDYHGDLSEWGSHTIDLCQLALGRELTAPVKYVPVGPGEIDAFYPDGVKLVMRSTGFEDSCAIRLEGDEGWVETDDSGGVAVSNPLLLEGHTIRHESWARPVQHPAEFIACVRSRLRASAPADSLHMTHVACHAASVAFHLNRAMAFDLKTFTFPGHADATQLLKRSNRAPWVLG